MTEIEKLLLTQLQKVVDLQARHIEALALQQQEQAQLIEQLAERVTQLAEQLEG